MVSWSLDLSEYDIKYVSIGIIKSQALNDFVVELSSPVKEDPPSKWALSVNVASNVKKWCRNSA